MLKVGDRVYLKGTNQWGIIEKIIIKPDPMIILDRRLETKLGWFWSFKKEELERKN